MLKKTSASTGLVIVTAAGALLTSSPAYALDSLVSGGSWSSGHHRSHHRNRNWNGNHHRGRIFIRIYIYNKNNNHAIAIARPEHRRPERRERDRLDTDFVAPAADHGPRTVRHAPAASAPAPAEQVPAATSQDGTGQSTAPANGTVGGPGAAGSAPSTSSLDEAATGGVTP